MTTKQQEEMNKRFDKEFIRQDGLLNISKYDHERILSFLQSEIDLAIAEDRQRIVQALNEHGFIANIIDDELHILSASTDLLTS